MEWEYDMGDSWNHDIVVQSIAPAGPGATLPRCTDGGGACPPEDCGGAWGYADLADALGNAGHPRHGEAVEILGEGYDPSHFRPPERRRGYAPYRPGCRRWVATRFRCRGRSRRRTGTSPGTAHVDGLRFLSPPSPTTRIARNSGCRDRPIRPSLSEDVRQVDIPG